MNDAREYIDCPYCAASASDPWAAENGFVAVKCRNCGFVYVNPRPKLNVVDSAVRTGIHNELEDQKSAIARRVPGRVRIYRQLFQEMFSDLWKEQRPISWLDIGAGYGEILEAVTAVAPAGSTIEGIEPMHPKAKAAKARGLAVRECYLTQVSGKYMIVSLVHVFSHIPDFRSFLIDVKKVLHPGGEFFIETGNAADLKDRYAVPTELDLPDHLTFAGRKHLVGFLEEAGFEIVLVNEIRRDGAINLMKNIVKKILGRNVVLRIPYTSAHRAIRVRARLRG